MTFKDIYKTVKPSLVKGVTLKALKEDKDIEGQAWQYAYMKTDNIQVQSSEDLARYNDIFMGHYTKAMKVLRKEVKQYDKRT
jgi:hypothetical protein